MRGRIIDAEAGEADIAGAVDEGAMKLGEAYRMLPGDHPKWSQAEWRQLLAAGADPETIFAIGSEVLGTVNKKGEFGAKQCSPLVMLNGGSHQNFLLHLRALVEPQPTVRVGRSAKEVAIDAKDKIGASLFARWTRGDNGRRRALRWDHQEVRDHGSRWSDPNEEDDMPIEWGAYRMAAVGWPVYRCGVRRGTTRHRRDHRPSRLSRQNLLADLDAAEGLAWGSNLVAASCADRGGTPERGHNRGNGCAPA